ncbi:MAG: rhodanese-like domain-containing protein [Cellvibrionaceae bacterium]
MEDILVFAQEQAFIVAALAILIFAFMRRESSSAGAKLSTSEVIQVMNADKAVLVDVRDTKEYDQGHVANALHIPHAKVNDSLGQLEKHRDKQIVITDSLGQHSAGVARNLLKAGFTVARMRGGMGEWKQDGLPLVK